MKLRTKLSAILVTVFLVIFIAISLIGYFTSRNNVEDKIISYLNSEAEITSAYIKDWLNRKLMAVDTVAKVFEKPYMLQQIISDLTVTDYLKPTGFDKDMVHYYLALEDKTFVTGSGWIPPEDYNPLQRPWYKAAKKANKPTFTETYIDMNTGKVSLSAVSPMKSQGGSVIGVVSSDIYLETLTKVVTEKSFGGMGYAFLLDEKGNILAHPNKEMVNTNVKDYENYKQLFNAIKSKKNGLEEYSDNRINKLMVYKNIPLTDWTFGIVIDKSKAYQPLNNLKRKYLIITLIGVGIIIILSLVVSHKIVGPIIVLSKIIDRLSNYDLRFDNNSKAIAYLRRKDEIGQITNSLAKMQKNLTNLIKKLDMHRMNWHWLLREQTVLLKS